MGRRRGGRAALVVTAVVVVAAGCGGSSRLSKAQYEQKIQAEGTQLKSASNALRISSVSDLKALAPKLGTLQQQTEKTASEIDKLNPPKDAVADNKKIAKTLHTFASLFGQMKAAAAANDKVKFGSLGRQVQQASQAGTQATNDLKSKGYSVGVLGQ